MHVHLPKPLHGWREFAGEVGIIVVGVLIALGAEQMVETIRGEAQVREFRHAADDELAYDLAGYQQRLTIAPCVTARVAELERAITSARAAHPITLHGLYHRPFANSQRTSVWADRTGEVSGRMALRTRLLYAALYDDLANYEAHRLDEREAWQELAEFDGASSLDARDIMRLRGLVSRISWLNDVIQANWPEEAARARALRIHPRVDPDDPPLKRGVCTTFLPKGAEVTPPAP